MPLFLASFDEERRRTGRGNGRGVGGGGRKGVSSPGEEEQTEVTWFGGESGRESHRKVVEWLVEGEAMLDCGEVIGSDTCRNRRSGASALASRCC